MKYKCTFILKKKFCYEHKKCLRSSLAFYFNVKYYLVAEAVTIYVHFTNTKTIFICIMFQRGVLFLHRALSLSKNGPRFEGHGQDWNSQVVERLAQLFTTHVLKIHLKGLSGLQSEGTYWSRTGKLHYSREMGRKDNSIFVDKMFTCFPWRRIYRVALYLRIRPLLLEKKISKLYSSQNFTEKIQ